MSRVAAEVLLELRFRIDKDVHDDDGAVEIDARESSPGKRSLHFRLKQVDSGRTRVAVNAPREASNFAEAVLDRISVRVGEELARLLPPVRVSVRGRYSGTAALCAAAADEALEKLEATIEERVVQNASARLEGRGREDTTFEILIDAEDPDSVEVVFRSGAEDKKTADLQVGRLKAEFEQALRNLR